MNRGRHFFFLVLSWLWIALVIGYLAWGAVNYSGLYRWLAEWQIEQWGGFYRKWTAALPGLLLCLPALLYIGWRGRLRQQAEAHSPAAQARTAGRGAKWLMLVGLLGMLIGEQALPVAKKLFSREPVTAAWLRSECVAQITGVPPAPASAPDPAPARETDRGA